MTILEEAAPVPAKHTTRRWSLGVATAATMILTASLLTSCDNTPLLLTGTVTVQSAVPADAGTAAPTSGDVTPSFPKGVLVALFANDSATPVATTTTNLAGHYEFSASTLADGTYRLEVNDTWWGGTSWDTATPITVSAASPSTIDVQLTAAGNIPGTIVDETHTGVPRIPVWATDSSGATVATTLADTSGAFTLGLVEQGDYTLHLRNASGTVDIGGESPVVFTIDYPINQNQAGWVDLITGERYPLDHIEAINGGDGFNCAVLSTGTVQCWGYNVDGALGNGTFDNISSVPVPVTGISDAVAVTTGLKHSCALRVGGAVSCWGFNEDGELGHGNALRETTPVSVSGVTDAVAITAGGFHTCALHSGGTISCWGYNHSGELGDGTTSSTNTPVTVTGIDDAVAITGGRYHTCAVHATGTVSCWGSNSYGAIGNGTDHNYFTTPVAVTGITDAVDVEAGEHDTCALHADGTVSCWGANFNGGLGDGTFDDSNVPVAVIGMGDATAIAAGAYHNCALRAGGTVSCWGYNYGGLLGGGTAGDSNEPVAVIGISDATAIGAGDYNTCAVHADDTASCWGDAPGDGTTWGSASPKTVIAGVLD